MPANLNALIRYTAINSCLNGGTRKCSIHDLIERCSRDLTEYRGRYQSISERTIRDDIRVMRSEMLGYNAPIKQYNGLYYYSNPYYSIVRDNFLDSALFERIIKFLIDIKPEIPTNHELDKILDRLLKLKESTRKVNQPQEVKVTKKIYPNYDGNFQQSIPPPSYPEYFESICWGDILDSLNIHYC
jgi:hypothetical protein